MYSEIARIDKSLRPYQQTAKKSIFAAWDECDNVMFQMPTGTGKTRLFTSIISDIKAWSILEQKEAKVLIIAHRVELIEQISESLEKYKVVHGIIAGGKERNLRPQVQVASIQTITHRTNIDIAKALGVDFVIIDEAHHSTANSYRKLWDLYPNAKKLGVTATPWRMNHSGFQSIYDKIILSKPIKEFIAEGWLAPYNYYSINVNSIIQKEIDSIEEYDIEGDYKISALERVMDNQQIRAQLLDSYLKFAKGKKGIIYSISRKHSDHICAEYKEAGVNIVRIDSKTPRDERNLYVKRFKNGQIDIIVNVDIFSEGFDCPDIEFVQLARPTKSLVKYLQQVGRGLRPTSGKSRCVILDNVGLHITFGLPDSDREWEEDFVGEQKTRKSSGGAGGGNATTGERPEMSFEEGSDEMCLIQSAAESEIDRNAQTTTYSITDEDLKLLTTLYVDKHCTLEMLETIFSLPQEFIHHLLDSLNLLAEQQ